MKPMTRNVSLTARQAELYAAMTRGVKCHYMTGDRNNNPYYSRNDTMKRCTREAMALFEKGLLKRAGTKYRWHLEAKS